MVIRTAGVKYQEYTYVITKEQTRNVLASLETIVADYVENENGLSIGRGGLGRLPVRQICEGPTG